MKKNNLNKSRKTKTRIIAPYRYLIVCEGVQTEPNYFNTIKKIIESSFPNRMNIMVLGTGYNTLSLVDKTIQTMQKSPIKYDKVWCVFDKDSFTDDVFNSAIKKATSKDISVAWSNEAVELWFLLHYNFYNTPINRDQYVTKLDAIFKESFGSGYSKNDIDIYEKIKICGGNLKTAINNAQKLDNYYPSTVSPAKQNPNTHVYKLMLELYDYLVL